MMESNKVDRWLTVLGLVLLGPLVIWDGFVLMKLWAWFVAAPLGVVALNLPQTIGLNLFVTALWYDPRRAVNNDRHPTGSMLATSLMMAMCLAIGWLIHFFV